SVRDDRRAVAADDLVAGEARYALRARDALGALLALLTLRPGQARGELPGLKVSRGERMLPDLGVSHRAGPELERPDRVGRHDETRRGLAGRRRAEYRDCERCRREDDRQPLLHIHRWCLPFVVKVTLPRLPSPAARRKGAPRRLRGGRPPGG